MIKNKYYINYASIYEIREKTIASFNTYPSLLIKFQF